MDVFKQGECTQQSGLGDHMTYRSRKSCSPKVILETVVVKERERERENTIDIANSLSTSRYNIREDKMAEFQQ